MPTKKMPPPRQPPPQQPPRPPASRGRSGSPLPQFEKSALRYSTGFLKQTALFPPLPPQTASWPLSVGGGGGRRVRKGTGDEGGGGDRGTRGKGRRERERGEREGGGGEGPPRLSPILPSFESFSRLLARIRALTDVGSFCVTTEVV